MSRSCPTSHASVPHSSLSLRSRKFFRIWNVPPDPSTLNGEKSVPSIEVEGEIVNTQWSNNGAIFAVTFQDQGLVLYTLNEPETTACLESLQLQPFPLPLPEQLQNLPTKQLKWIVFSPQGTYLCTFWIPNGLGLTELTGPNYYVWRISRSEQGAITGASIVFSDTYKTLSSPGPMQWRDDEQVRVFTRNGTLQIYDGHDFEKPALAVLSLAPRFTISIASYCSSEPDAVSITMFAPASQAGDTPGEVRFLLCKITQREKDNAGVLHARSVVPVKIGVKELSGVDGCDFSWSPSGRMCMMMTSTLVDAAGDNYGSVGDLWLCDLNLARKKRPNSGDGAEEDERLASVKENMGMQQSGLPVDIEYLQIRKINERVTQDAKWSPTADEFVLIEGKAPSDIYLYDGISGERVHTFAKGYKNQIVWNRQGDMVAIGGFGNLAGDLSFYYRDGNRQVTLINEWRESCTVLCDWSPCGNYFFTASVRPRMNVDNQIKLWSREGTQLLHIPFDELNGVEWRQAPSIKFPAPAAPKPAERMQNKTTYRPRNWASSSADSQLMTRYYNGEITENELPEELRKRVATRSNRTNGARGYSEKARYGATDKACDTVMDWRSSEPVSEEKKEVSEGTQSDLAAAPGSSGQAASQPPPSLAGSAKVETKKNAAAEDLSVSAPATKKETLSRKARKEQNRSQQAQQPPPQAAGVTGAAAKRSSGVNSERAAKAAQSGSLMELSSTEPTELTKKQTATIMMTSDTVVQAPRETVVLAADTQKDGGAGPPAGVNSSLLRDDDLKAATEVPPVPVTLPCNVQPPPKAAAAAAKYGGVTSVEPIPVSSVQIPSQYSVPQPVAQATAKSMSTAPETMLPYLPHPFPVYGSSGNVSTDRLASETLSSGAGLSGAYPKWDPTQVTKDSEVPRVGSLYPAQPVASSSTNMIGKDHAGRLPPNYNTAGPVMHHQPRSYDNVVVDSRVPPIVDKMSVPLQPMQQSAQQQSPPLSDNSILSLLQSILPSHAKLHVRAEPEGLAVPATSAMTAGNSMPAGAESSSSFLRYFDKPAQATSPPYAFRPQSKMSTRTPSQPLQQSYTNVSPPPPAFPNPRQKEEMTDKERELEQARFIALIEQAGLKLPNLSFAGSRPAAAPTPAPAPASYINPVPQSRQRRWQGQNANQAGPMMNPAQQAQKVKPSVGMSEQFWPSIQDVFSNKELQNPQGNWGVKQMQETKRRGGAYPIGPTNVSQVMSQRHDECGGRGRGNMMSSNDSSNIEMDANLRELLKTLQSQSSQQSSAEYAVKELLQSSVNAIPAQQQYMEHPQQVDVPENRKRVQAGWQQDIPSVRRLQQQQQPSSPHDIEVKHKSAYDSMQPGGSRRVWQYVDPKGVVQGPFSRREMRAWWEKGYFAGDLPVRCDMQEDFVPLQEMFPGGEKVFAEI